MNTSKVNNDKHPPKGKIKMSNFATDTTILQACEEAHNYLLDTPYSFRYVDMLVARVESKLLGKDYFYNEKHFENLCVNFAISKGMMKK